MSLYLHLYIYLYLYIYIYIYTYVYLYLYLHLYLYLYLHQYLYIHLNLNPYPKLYSYQSRNLLPGAIARDLVCPNILCLEHHVPNPYDSFTDPTLQHRFFPTGNCFFPMEVFFVFLAGASAPRCRPKLALRSPPPPPQGCWAAPGAAAICKVER